MNARDMTIQYGRRQGRPNESPGKHTASRKEINEPLNE